MVDTLKHSFQLKDHRTGQAINASGGNFVVCTAGSPDRATLYDPDDNTSLSQPVAFVRGQGRFDVADTVNSVDIYGFAPGGQFFFYEGVTAQEFTELMIDQGQRHQVAKIPWSHADSTANTETDTGFDLPENAIVLPNAGILVVDTDATETIDVGLAAGESGGDADGFLDGLSIATAGFVKGTLASGGQTLGALLRADESGAGVLVPESHIGDGTAESIVYTTTAGTDTGSGFILLPYYLAGAV